MAAISPSLPVLLTILAVPACSQTGADPIVKDLSQKQFGAALQAADARLKTSPGDARIWAWRGAALYGLQQTKESLDSYRKALRIQPDFLPALEGAAEIEYATKDPQAKKTLARILSLDAHNEVAHAMTGVLAFEARDCDSAVTHFANALRLVERQKASLEEYGYCLLQLNRGAEAAPVFVRLIATDPADPRIRLNLVLALAAAGRPAEAIEYLKPLAEADAPGADVLGLMGELYRANGQLENGIAAYRRGIELYPKEERLYIGLAALCSYYNSLDLGLEILNVGLKNIADSSRLYAMRGVLYNQLGRQEESMADFEHAIRLSPDTGAGRTGRGLSMLQEGRADDLIRDARARLQSHPQDADSHFLLAQALLRKGARPGDAAFREAQSALENAVRIDSRFDQAHAALGKLYLDLGKSDLSIRELETALKFRPENRVAIYQLMLAYRAAGRSSDVARLQERLRTVMEQERAEDLKRSQVRLTKAPEASAR